MGDVYAVSSAKGGVGKTTTAVNLAATLAAAGHDVVGIDGDLATPNFAAAVGLEAADATIHELLAGEATPEAATYRGPHGLRVVPGRDELDAFRSADPGALAEVIGAFDDADYVIVDTSAGLTHGSALPLSVADGTLLVTTPDRDALAATRKTAVVARELGGSVAGVALNRAGPDDEVVGVDAPVLGVIPDSSLLERACAAAQPITTFAPASGEATAYRRLASRLTVSRVPPPSGTDDAVAADERTADGVTTRGAVSGTDSSHQHSDDSNSDVTEVLGHDSADATAAGEADTTETGATATGDPDTAETGSTATGESDATETDATATGESDTTETDATATGDSDATETDATTPSQPDTAETQATAGESDADTASQSADVNSSAAAGDESPASDDLSNPAPETAGDSETAVSGDSEASVSHDSEASVSHDSEASVSNDPEPSASDDSEASMSDDPGPSTADDSESSADSSGADAPEPAQSSGPAGGGATAHSDAEADPTVVSRGEQEGDMIVAAGSEVEAAKEAKTVLGEPVPDEAISRTETERGDAVEYEIDREAIPFGDEERDQTKDDDSGGFLSWLFRS